MKQESPPAWTQEAYRPPCSEYSFCCPTWVPPPGGYPVRYPPGGGTRTPPVRYPPWGGTRTPLGVPGQVPPQGGYPDPPGVPGQVPPPGGVPGHPPGGVPGQVPPRGGYLTGYPPRPMAFWEMLQSIMGYGYPPPVDRQMDEWKDRRLSKHYLPSYSVRGR